MTLTDPYPQDISELEDTALGFAEPDPTIKALNRIATALERLVPTPAQNGPGLAALPPVRPPAQNGGVCPNHNTPWKTVPAGISKRTGNAYQAFQACSTDGCDQRPPR